MKVSDSQSQAAGHNTLLSRTETGGLNGTLKKNVEDRKTSKERNQRMAAPLGFCVCLFTALLYMVKTKQKRNKKTRTTDGNYKMEIYSLSPLAVYVHTLHWKANCTGNSFVHYKCNIVLWDCFYILCAAVCVWSGVFPKLFQFSVEGKKQRIPRMDFRPSGFKCFFTS